MNNDFLVSVVIPVYNAEKYIARAIYSVNDLKEVGEILIIDDGSSDNSLQICKQAASTVGKIKILTHENKANKGPSASRNLGILHSTFDYISFLDSDDYYLPHRFNVDRRVFAENQNADGVYGCNIEVFETDRARELFMAKRSSIITTISEVMEPERLYRILLFGGYGEFHISTITVKKEALLRAGLFNLSLRYGEDTELWIKMAVNCKLYPGDIKQPIAVRNVHENNSIHDWDKVAAQYETLYQSLLDWILTQNVPFNVKNDFFSALYMNRKPPGISLYTLLCRQIVRNPALLLDDFIYRKYFLELIS